MINFNFKKSPLPEISFQEQYCDKLHVTLHHNG